MKAYIKTKEIPKKPMRLQLRGERKKDKTVKTDQKQRHGQEFLRFRKQTA